MATQPLFHRAAPRYYDRRLRMQCHAAHVVPPHDARGSNNLRRNAAYVQATPPSGATLDQRHLEDQVGGAKRGRVAAGACAKHREALTAGGTAYAALATGVVGPAAARRARRSRRAPRWSRTRSDIAAGSRRVESARDAA